MTCRSLRALSLISLACLATVAEARPLSSYNALEAVRVQRDLPRLSSARMQKIHALAAKTPLRPGLTRASATDLLFVILGPELYRSLVLECGWSQADWQAWATSALTRDLFGGKPHYHAPGPRPGTQT